MKANKALEQKVYRERQNALEEKADTLLKSKGWLYGFGEYIIGRKPITFLGVDHFVVFAVSAHCSDTEINYWVTARQKVDSGAKVFPNQYMPCQGWGMLYGSGTFSTLEEAESFALEQLDKITAIQR